MSTPGTTCILPPKCALRTSDSSVFTVRLLPCMQNRSQRSESVARKSDRYSETPECSQLRVRSTIFLACTLFSREFDTQSVSQSTSFFISPFTGTSIKFESTHGYKRSITDLCIKFKINLVFYKCI